MGKIDEFVVSYAMYENGTEYMGTTEVTLPDLEFMTEELSGAGIAGKVEEVITGNMNAMTTTFNFRTVGKWTARLLEPRVHNIDLRVAQQKMETKDGTTSVSGLKHIMKIKPKKTALGKVSAATTSDASGEYSVLYYALYVDGVKVTEVDPLNFICIINGRDFLEEVRKALGK